MERVNDRKQRRILNRSHKGFQAINKKYEPEAGEKSHLMTSFYPRQQREFKKLLGF